MNVSSLAKYPRQALHSLKLLAQLNFAKILSKLIRNVKVILLLFIPNA